MPAGVHWSLAWSGGVAIAVVAMAAGACHRPPNAEAGRLPPPSVSVAAESSTTVPVSSDLDFPPDGKLHVIAEGWDGGLKGPSALELCLLDGAAFVCGGPGLLYIGDRGVRHDLVHQQGLGQPPDVSWAWTGSMHGSWPDNAWLRTGSAGTVLEHVYQWDSDRWVHRGEVSGLGMAAVVWQQSRLLMARCGAELECTIESFGLEPSVAVPRLETREADGLRPDQEMAHVELRALVSGDVFGLVHRVGSDPDLLVRWKPGEVVGTIVHRGPVPSARGDCSLVGIVELSTERIVLRGLLGNRQGACRIELLGSEARASAMAAPLEDLRARVRTGDAEWALTGYGETGAIWRQAAGESWRRIQLPGPAFPTGVVDSELRPLRLEASTTEVWVLAHYTVHSQRAGSVDRRVLLSSVRRRPCDLNQDTSCAGDLARAARR